MLHIFWFFLLLLHTINSFEEFDSDGCLNVKSYAWKHLGTKTPYRYLANKNDSVPVYEGCDPKKLFVIVRHGTRYPSKKFINQIRTKLPELRDAIVKNIKQKSCKLCSAHANNITLWKPQIDIVDEKRLSHEGEDEMIELAERFQHRFPSLLTSEYSNLSYTFRSTATERAIKSKYYFTVGLFGKRIAHHVWSPEPLFKDPILRFYKLCSKWIKEVDKNPKSLRELEAFKETETAKKILKDISERLGFEESLEYENVELMYMMCSYETAWNRFAFSPWCSIFSQEEMKAMEFGKDLKHYWVDGYGHDINFQQACPMMENMLHHLKSEEGPTSVFYFTHSGTILKLLSHLGLYYDQFKITHDKFSHPRLWKLSHIDAFGTNLAFITYQCGDKMKLLTLHQERFVKLPGCPKEGLCVFDKVLKTYQNSFRNCQFDEICKIKQSEKV